MKRNCIFLKYSFKVFILIILIGFNPYINFSLRLYGNENKVREVLNSLYKRGCSEFREKQFSKAINTFNDVIYRGRKAIDAFPASSGIYRDVISRSQNQIVNARNAANALIEFRKAVNEYRNNQYDQCINSIDSFLKHELNKLGLGDYIARANRINKNS